VRIAGSRTVLPNPAKIPTLMHNFWSWLNTQSEAVERAVEAHYKLVTIHPFADGNGRTARLVMNLILRASGYPPIIIRKEDRGEYLSSLEIAQTGGSRERYLTLMLTSLLTSLDRYIDAMSGSAKTMSNKLITIGKLAKSASESVPTIRHWVTMGIIPVAQLSFGGYQLFEPSMVERAKLVREMQKKKRLSLEEIRKELS
jgi:Fic family protein